MVITVILSIACDEDKGRNISIISVRLNKTALSLLEGTKETLKVSILPSNATNQNVTWLSDNSGIASVDEVGEISAVAGSTAPLE